MSQDLFQSKNINITIAGSSPEPMSSEQEKRPARTPKPKMMPDFLTQWDDGMTYWTNRCKFYDLPAFRNRQHSTERQRQFSTGEILMVSKFF